MRSILYGCLVVTSQWPMWVVVGLGICGCRQRSLPRQSAPVASAAPSGVPLALPSVSLAADSGVASGARAEQDLLGIVPAKIAVSSAVRNPRDFPEHLIDGNPHTAWNSRTGDLVGAWIAFRVPVDAHVDAIELTAGYARVKGQQDLFTMNHRVSLLEISRDGKLFKLVPLDVQSRALQRVPINAAGGEFKLVVKETVPGSEAKWREVVISEFRVLGKPGAERRPSTDRLVVSVGSLDAAPPEPIRGELDFDVPPIAAELRASFPSIDRFCKAFLAWAKVNAAAEIAEDAQWNDAAPVLAPLCTEVALPSLQNAAPPWTAVKAARMAWAYRDSTRLFVVTPKGVRMTPIYFDDRRGNPMGCPPVWSHERLDRLRVQNGWLIATIDGSGPSNYDANTQVHTMTYQRGAAMCRAAGENIRCLEVNPQYDRSFATKTLSYSGGHAQSPDAVLWERVEDFQVSEKGEISRVRVR